MSLLSADAASEVVLTAIAVRPTIIRNVGSASGFVLTATAPSAGVLRKLSTSFASVVLTVTASAIPAKLGNGHVRLILRAIAVCGNQDKPTFSIAPVILRVRARRLIPKINFGGDYLGRFQQGQEVPLWVIVRDQHGSPTDPILVTPRARIYSLDTMTAVETVDLIHLRYARIGQVYSLPLRLTVSYPVGRYGVLFQTSVDSFAGVSLSLFEVVASGDPAGPVIAAYTVAESTGDLVLGHLASGAVVVGGKPGIS